MDRKKTSTEIKKEAVRLLTATSYVVMHKLCPANVSLKQHYDAPYPAETDEDVKNRRYDGTGAEDPGDEIEVKQSDEQPVQCADDHENQGNDVHEITPFTALVCA